MFNDLVQQMRDHLEHWRGVGAPSEPGVMTLELEPGELEEMVNHIVKLRESLGEVTRYENGLAAMRTVLDYGTDSESARMNIMVWLKNGVDALLRGEEVEVPPRNK